VVDGFDEGWAGNQAGAARSLGRNQESSKLQYSTTAWHVAGTQLRSLSATDARMLEMSRAVSAPLSRPRLLEEHMRTADPEPIQSACRLVEEFAERLPPGEREDHVRRSLKGALMALRTERCVEDAVRQLVAALHQLDEDAVGGRRREFQRNAPAVGRLLQALQEELFPLLRSAGYRV
jgi:hypothetical protein